MIRKLFHLVTTNDLRMLYVAKDAYGGVTASGRQ